MDSKTFILRAGGPDIEEIERLQKALKSIKPIADANKENCDRDLIDNIATQLSTYFEDKPPLSYRIINAYTELESLVSMDTKTDSQRLGMQLLKMFKEFYIRRAYSEKEKADKKTKQEEKNKEEKQENYNCEKSLKKHAKSVQGGEHFSPFSTPKPLNDEDMKKMVDTGRLEKTTKTEKADKALQFINKNLNAFILNKFVDKYMQERDNDTSPLTEEELAELKVLNQVRNVIAKDNAKTDEHFKDLVSGEFGCSNEFLKTINEIGYSLTDFEVEDDSHKQIVNNIINMLEQMKK